MAFELESYSQCKYDSLIIYDGSTTNSNLYQKFCGTASPGTFDVSGNTATLQFNSDYSETFNGFSIYYWAYNDIFTVNENGM